MSTTSAPVSEFEARVIQPITAATQHATVARVLVVDDEPDLRELLELTLVRMGLDVDVAATVDEAHEFLRRHRYALCLTDMRLPDGSGMSLVEAIARDYPATLVAVITAYGSADNAVAALKAGAFDYLSKPVGIEQLRNLVRSALQAAAQVAMLTTQETDAIRPAVSSDTSLVDRLLGQSEAMREIRALIIRVACSQAPVVISGESGSGKELVARAIHDCSGRAQAPFVAVNCGAISEQLMEAEFFGYRKGAFTGAQTDRDGFFQAACGGTLFLDEVAELPLAMQVKLLRAIQERSVRRVGSVSEELVDVRLLSATHQHLGDCVAQGRFRQDLYYRLHVIAIHLPALRERRSDIPQIAQHLLKQLAPHLHLSKTALEKLLTYDYPGNVRELNNVLERSAAFAATDVIDATDIQWMSTPTLTSEPEPNNPAVPNIATQTVDAAPTLTEHLDQVERTLIERALAQTRYNRRSAAALLGISFRQLRYRMQRLGIQ